MTLLNDLQVRTPVHAIYVLVELHEVTNSKEG